MAIRRSLARSELPIDTVSLARYLIGKVLVRELPEGVASVVLLRRGVCHRDAAGHAYRGMTQLVEKPSADLIVRFLERTSFG